MDQLRVEAGLSLTKLSTLVPSQESLLLAVLEHHQLFWMQGIQRAAEMVATPRGRLLSVCVFCASGLPTIPIVAAADTLIAASLHVR